MLLCSLLHTRALFAADIIIDKSDRNYGPTFLTINVKPLNRIFDTDMHDAPIRERLRPTSLEIETRSGEVSHQFEVDGTASICLRASTANAHNPLAFGWRVVTSTEMPSLRVQKNRKDSVVVTTDVDQHLTHMEGELQRITNAMEHVLKEADMNRHQDEAFHAQTLAMHSATTFWPIVQVCVLLMTGFTQASHIVRFFKSRRII
jgi:emp24/gp25L/p24 family/GOLD